MGPFKPGQLTTGDAAKLNELWAGLQRFNRLTVAAPLQLTRHAGIPVISARGFGGPLLAEITGNDAATPPVHTVKRKTRDHTDNTVTDYSPAQTFDQVLSPDETAIADGTLVELVAIPDFPDWYWAYPHDAATAIATTSYSPGGITISADNTWTSDSGSVSLGAGEYLAVAHLYYQAKLSAATTADGAGVLVSVISARLWNDTDSGALTDAYALFGMQAADLTRFGTGVFSQRITLSGTKTIKLQAMRNIPYDSGSGQTWTFAQILNSSAGLWTTRVDFHKLA